MSPSQGSEGVYDHSREGGSELSADRLLAFVEFGVTLLDPGPWGGKSLPGQDELPSDDGEPMETSFHHAQGNLLIESLAFAWNDRRDFCVAGNMFVYFSEHQIKRNDFRGPDVFVVPGTERKPRKSWVLWEEGGKVPDVVIEVTSESPKAVDRGEKMRLYSSVWRTPYYFIFDPETDQLEGYRLDVDRLADAPAPVDERGDYSVTLMNLKLGLRQSDYRDWNRLFVRGSTRRVTLCRCPTKSLGGSISGPKRSVSGPSMPSRECASSRRS